jgi:hypothetical protein
MEGVSNWIGTTGFNSFMLNTPWAFPAAETVHFMGLTLLLGSLLVVDLRGMGMLRIIPFEQAHKLIPLAITGFALNLITGICFLFADPDAYFGNLGFWYKMVFIALAGLNALAFEFLVFQKYKAGDLSAADGLTAKITSALSLVFWFNVLILGRFLPYTSYCLTC